MGAKFYELLRPRPRDLIGASGTLAYAIMLPMFNDVSAQDIMTGSAAFMATWYFGRRALNFLMGDDE